MEDDWNLYAVVRGCAAATASTITTDYCSQDIHLPYGFQSQEEHSLFPSDPFEPRHSQSMDDLHDLVKPFFPKIQPPISLQNTPISPLSVLGFHDLSPSPIPKQKQEKPKQNHSSVAGGGTISTSNTTTRRSKRRKKQLKRVCEVPAEGLSCDTWCWRKYGQKPIKGSPFPRGYYKCSTSKMCFARKQVERSRPDPGMFLVTYTGEHNHPMPTHRNTLAGIPRQKSVAPDTVTAGDSSKPPSSPPVSPLSEKTETSEDLLMEDEDDELGGVSDTPIGDDFFEGLEELRGDCFCDQFPATFTFPWGPHFASTTAAGSAP